ncbi:conjugal transfer protein TraF [Nitrosophilus labii]|uniref:conjugal transfer protein TraF n=1 Tax=Nitrosophilus labii TaxID=2706014 RepID=UPI001656A28A|nr:conjugal transfer protein TraF [Nitrosophilus labii]
MKFFKYMVFCMIVVNTFASNDFFSKGKEGWFYYKEEKIENKNDENKTVSDEEFIKTIPYDRLDDMTADEFGELLEKTKKIAVMKPTKENVRAVMRLKKYMLDKAEKFTKVQYVLMLEEPELEYPEIGKDKFARSTQFLEKEKEKKEFFKKHKEDLAFVMFYKSENELAFKRQKIIYQMLERDYGVETEFVNLQERPELVSKFKIKTTPDNFFIYKNSRGEAIWMRIKAGLATKEELVKNTMFLFENAIKESDK